MQVSGGSGVTGRSGQKELGDNLTDVDMQVSGGSGVTGRSGQKELGDNLTDEDMQVSGGSGSQWGIRGQWKRL